LQLGFALDGSAPAVGEWGVAAPGSFDYINGNRYVTDFVDR
jgi:hypothetical protein